MRSWNFFKAQNAVYYFINSSIFCLPLQYIPHMALRNRLTQVRNHFEHRYQLFLHGFQLRWTKEYKNRMQGRKKLVLETKVVLHKFLEIHDKILCRWAVFGEDIRGNFGFSFHRKLCASTRYKQRFCKKPNCVSLEGQKQAKLDGRHPTQNLFFQL